MAGEMWWWSMVGGWPLLFARLLVGRPKRTRRNEGVIRGYKLSELGCSAEIALSHLPAGQVFSHGYPADLRRISRSSGSPDPADQLLQLRD